MGGSFMGNYWLCCRQAGHPIVCACQRLAAPDQTPVKKKYQEDFTIRNSKFLSHSCLPSGSPFLPFVCWDLVIRKMLVLKRWFRGMTLGCE